MLCGLRDPGPWLFCEAGQGSCGVQGKGCGIWRDGVCSWDEREAAGSWAVGLFLFHLRASGQSLDKGGRERMGEKGVMGSRSQEREGR